MKLLDFLRFHFIETILGSTLLGVGLYKAITYVEPRSDLPFSSPIPVEAVCWAAAASGAFVLVRALYVWDKTRTGR